MAAALSATPTTGAGSVSITSGSTTVIGTGTAFTSGSVNQIIIIGDWNALITGYVSATQVTVGDAPDFTVSGASYKTVAGATYTIKDLWFILLFIITQYLNDIIKWATEDTEESLKELPKQ